MSFWWVNIGSHRLRFPYLTWKMAQSWEMLHFESCALHYKLEFEISLGANTMACYIIQLQFDLSTNRNFFQWLRKKNSIQTDNLQLVRNFHPKGNRLAVKYSWLKRSHNHLESQALKRKLSKYCVSYNQHRNKILTSNWLKIAKLIV